MLIPVHENPLSIEYYQRHISSPLMQLPEEIIFHILSFHPKDRSVLLTCKTIYRIGFEIKDVCQRMLVEAIKISHLELCQRLLKHCKINPATNFQQAIKLACDVGDPRVAAALLNDPRVDPSAWSDYSIVRASANGHLGVVKELLSHSKVDPSENDNQAIRCASENGHLAVVKELLKDRRVDPSACYNYAIKNASYNGHLAVVKETPQRSKSRSFSGL